MSRQNDVALNASVFRPSAIPEACHALNKALMDLQAGQPNWWELITTWSLFLKVGAQNFRQMRLRGETAFPKPVVLECGQSFSIPSRQKGRDIPCRIITPEGNGTPSGVFMHIHGGGWVLSDEIQDSMLKSYADTANVVAVSVGYRLAPEFPFPSGPEDCYDAAEWLVDNAEKKFGAPFKFMGGESAGAHLSTLTAFHLLNHAEDKYSSFNLKGLVLQYGAYDLSYTPSMYTYRPGQRLILDRETVDHFIDAFLPDPKVDRKHASISPLYFDFASLAAAGKYLPPAIFTCGTEDILLDDTVFMSAKWQMAGGETFVKIVPGAPHGFSLFPPKLAAGTAETLMLIGQFLNEKAQ
ncbi:hypothetical protein LOZ54_002396 [Ophidiomyces ophidiicola]|nr:hypothetical protein LOZ54_002396 [Ophidiomyces ophidiicola]